MTDEEIHAEFKDATDRRIFAIGEALRRGWSVEDIAKETCWDVFFVEKLKNIIDMEKKLKSEPLTDNLLKQAKEMGYSDENIAMILGNHDEWSVME